VISRLAKIPDAVVAAALGVGSFLLLFVGYWFPPDKIFDEVYFARAAEEYLQRRYIYESTHPPLTKLIITLSTMMFGGLAHGDTAYGWRFLDVVAGAVAVVLVFILARRITRSQVFATYAALLFGLDGMHFVQSRIATPESFVVCFSLATIYGFIRYWDAIAEQVSRAVESVGLLQRGMELVVAAIASSVFVMLRFSHDALYARIVVIVVATAAVYGAYRLLRDRSAGWNWLLLFAFAGAALVASKWYGVMAYGVATIVLAYCAARAWHARRSSPFPLDTVIAVAVAAIGIVYALAYIPHFVGLRDLQTLPPRAYTLTDVVDMQVGAYKYHSTLVATHPYASVWWQWPLDARPVLYYANYTSGPPATSAWIISLPNPLLLWAGLVALPFVGWLAWTKRDRGYAVIVLAYLLQWLPWMRSPRIAFAYHFYVDIPLIAVCVAVTMQWVWERFKDVDRKATLGAIVGYLVLVALAFAYFYPILSGLPEAQPTANEHLWVHTWI
jgi:dolichyl-phosphate-mannose-protein mannosyltransferase